MLPMLKKEMEENKKSVFFVLSDNGPDFYPSALINTIYYYQLFCHLQLDMLSVLTYAARYSAFNPIEHLRSPLSNALAGVIQPSCVPGESLPPAKQSTKTQTPEERRSKEKIVFDNAMSTCSAHWKNITFDNFPINVHIVKCNQDELLFNDYEEVKKFLSCPLRDLHKYSKLNKEFQEMLNHIDRHLNEIVFTKCTNEKCCEPWI